jgi:hypothetical protein
MNPSPKPQREYLVALVAWSTHHLWIKADNETQAEDQAHELWAEDESAFSYKDGGVDGVTVLETRELSQEVQS